MAKIESVLRRPGGTRVDLFGTEYHFVPQVDGREIADITDPVHVSRFLAIPEGYRLAEDETGTAEPVTAVPGPTKADLIEKYTELYGKAPDKRWSVAKLEEAIAAHGSSPDEWSA